MPVFKYLDLSTAHLTEREMSAVNARLAELDDYTPRVVAHEYGAWVNVNLDREIEVVTDEIGEGYPNLARCLELARELGCNWINFDQDASHHEGLPTHDW